MDLDAIRSRFIREGIRKALNGGDQLMAWVTAHEFRRYFQWYRDSLPEPEKREIDEQLARLEQLCRRVDQQELSTHSDRVRHQFQETTLA